MLCYCWLCDAIYSWMNFGQQADCSLFDFSSITSQGKTNCFPRQGHLYFDKNSVKIIFNILFEPTSAQEPMLEDEKQFPEHKFRLHITDFSFSKTLIWKASVSFAGLPRYLFVTFAWCFSSRITKAHFKRALGTSILLG